METLDAYYITEKQYLYLLAAKYVCGLMLYRHYNKQNNPICFFIGNEKGWEDILNRLKYLD